jgi:exonuclease SbcD
VPVFKKLEQVRGDWKEIKERILELSAINSNAWLEVIYEGDEVISDLRERMESFISDTEIEILRIKNNKIADRMLRQMNEEETLEELNVYEVFQRCLDAHNIPEEQRPELTNAYQEILLSLYEDDVQAE